MQLCDVSQAHVGRALGDRAAASAMLSGKRQIGKAQAEKLAELFKMDAGLFT